MRSFPIKLICLFLTMGVFAVCLWPYNFNEMNRISVLPDGGGIRFEAPALPDKNNPGGILFLSGGLDCRSNPGCEPGAAATEIRLMANYDNSSCIRRILDVREAGGSETFYLGQWKSHLIIRSFASPTAWGRPYREIGVANALAAGGAVTVAVASTREGSAVYVDGRLAKQSEDVHLLGENDSLAGRRLFLGNAPEISCPWSGVIYGLAIYGRGIEPGEAMEGLQAGEAAGPFCEGERTQKAVACYGFGEIAAEGIADMSGSRNHLTAARRLFFEKPALHMARLSELDRRDVVSNVAGFIPLGFMYAFRQYRACRKSLRRSAVEGILLGFALSMAVELIQAWLPTRDSSMADLIANTVGAGIGAAGVIVWTRCRRRLSRVLCRCRSGGDTKQSEQTSNYRRR